MPAQLDLFKERLPRNLYCSNTKDGLRLKSFETAIQKKYIQLSYSHYKTNFAVDLDDPESHTSYYWKERTAPTPNILACNPVNGHSQALYLLNNGVSTSIRARKAPQDFYNDVRWNVTSILDGDQGYRNFAGWNPLSNHWEIVPMRKEPYDLGELAEYKAPQTKIETEANFCSYETGRNCYIFEELRHWAYRHFTREMKDNYNLWFDAVLDTAMNINSQLEYKLYYTEVKGIARSVSKWTHRHSRTFEDYVKQTHTTEIQNKRRIKGLEVRKDKQRANIEKLVEYMTLYPDMTIKECSEYLKVSYKTAKRYCSKLKEGTFTYYQDSVLN